MSSPALLAGLARTRIALMIAGLAWFFGLSASWPARAAVAALVVAALVLDAAADGAAPWARLITVPRPRTATSGRTAR